MSDNDKRETHAALIAEMRDFAKGSDSTVEDWADRLEAAHRRELAAGGDAAALREALQAFAEWFDHDGSEDGYGDIRDKARAALSAPPRNCERFATADDARREFNYLWNFVWQRGGGCLNERNYEEEFERWLFAPATAKEGGAR